MLIASDTEAGAGEAFLPLASDKEAGAGEPFLPLTRAHARALYEGSFASFYIMWCCLVHSTLCFTCFTLSPWHSFRGVQVFFTLFLACRGALHRFTTETHRFTPEAHRFTTEAQL